MPITHTRRRLITTLSWAGAGFVLGPKPLAGEERPETTTVRLAKKIPVLCNAPQYIADDLLRAEGFRDIQYVVSGPGAALSRKIADGAIDFSMGYAGPNVIAVDAREAIVNLAGLQARAEGVSGGGTR
jgi:NitT/TauT family transport system substrate-binding protein